MQSKVKARSGLCIFFVVLIAGSAYFEHRILVTTGDELGALAQSFNEMTASVRKAMRDMLYRKES